VSVAEAALRIVNLHRGQTKVVQDTVEALAGEGIRQFGVQSEHRPEPVPEPGESFRRDADGLRIAVDAHDALHASVEERARVPACAHGHVEHQPAISQQLGHLCDHDRLVRRARHVTRAAPPARPARSMPAT
jgi:hypothetical protein